MPLTDEQRSMLQLLLEGGQGYGDIASLLGVSEDDVRSRVRAALREMGGADPDAQVGLSDYLLGKADPIGRADAVRHLQADPAAHDLASRLLGQLRLIAPRADLPDLPPPRGGRRAAPAPAGASSAPSAAGGHPQDDPSPLSRVRGALSGAGEGDPRRARLLAALGVGALLILAVVAVVVLGGGDDDGGGGDDADGTAAEELVIARLAPVSGGGATGQAVFAQAQDQAFLQLNLSGLQPAPKGSNYIVWLYNSDQIAFPLSPFRVPRSGDFSGAAPIPQQLLPLVPQFGCVDISLSTNKEAQQATRVQGQQLPRYAGQSVLRGQIPAVGQEAPSGADAVCDQPVGGAAEGAGATPEGGQSLPEGSTTPGGTTP